MPKTDGLTALILEATAAGFDVTIRLLKRDDGQEGKVSMPGHWARQLGYEEPPAGAGPYDYDIDSR